MAGEHGQDVRPLFVVSNDYGELGLAMHFLRGQRFAPAAAFALPDRLYPTHRDILPGATHHYGSREDVLALAEAHQANVVLLFSGYLLANNGILSHEAVEAMVGGLRDRGCVVLTTDPFLGLASRLTPAHVGLDVPVKPSLRQALQPFEQRFVADLGRSAGVLASVIHLYHSAPQAWTARQTSPSAAFFNATPLVETPYSPEKRWLFVLGSEDVWVQQRLMLPSIQGTSTEDAKGFSRFAAVVARLLEQTAALERRPTLVAPPALIEALPARLLEACDLRPFCPFPEFTEYVLRSEFVFYWNAFSASILPRLALKLPTFFFDKGHMARLIQPLYDLGLELHFGGWSPNYLDPLAALDLEDLVGRWHAHGLGNHLVLDVFRRECPSPAELLEHVVGHQAERPRPPDH